MWKKEPRKFRAQTSQAALLEQSTRTNDFDTAVMGYEHFSSGGCRRGYMVNFHETLVTKNGDDFSGIDMYFIDYDGGRFKSTIFFAPYLLLLCTNGRRNEVEEYLRRHSQLSELLQNIEWCEREDLQQVNHLIGTRQHLLKISFNNTGDLGKFRKIAADIASQNKIDAQHTHELAAHEHILDVREYDVPYHVRVFIDLDLRVGKWYKVWNSHGQIQLKELVGSGQVIIDEHEFDYNPDLHDPQDVVDWDVPAMPQVLAWDIEAAKKDLMFPDPESPEDEITMISYMINDSTGFLITNRSYVSKDIDDFEFNPKPEYPGPFQVFNEPDEKSLLQRWFDHVREIRPMVMVTFNGDFFDWPYVAKRARRYGLDISDILGFAEIKGADEYWSSPNCCHLDVFSWVKRDSYLPQGSQGLKQVTQAKLKFKPLELDPEEMTPFASEKPQVLAEYSVSDAVATYYLYHKFVHPFIFSLCKILPLPPDEVLRKGTGTLCEMLLMVQAYQGDILLPHKHKEASMKYYEGHLIESETYSGGHVECLHAGVFRNDLDYQFKLNPETIQTLIDELDETLRYTIKAEMGIDLEASDNNYLEVFRQIESMLVTLRDTPDRFENPYIYHLDVASMYPNIMTTNRLQPDSMVTDDDCRKCHYYTKDRECARTLAWQWRVEYWGAEASDKRMLEKMLQESTFKVRKFDQDSNKWVSLDVGYDQLPQDRKDQELRAKIASYSKQSKKQKVVKDIEKDVIVCQRETPFYIDTVQSFKNRRIDYKRQSKQFEGEARAATNPLERDLLMKKHIAADSMQLAHKVILNSFYGYVKRKGSRWYSDEMAGVTCFTGAKIIQEARTIVDGIGISLELDTDGIWCMLPNSFPTIFDLVLDPKNGGKQKKVKIEYPGAILNYMVWKGYTNPQYQTKKENSFEYDVSVRNSIFFEVDGPYKAMILPTSKEKGINLKKRYAVFHLNGSLAELKGFELKRRGELEIVKSFQADLFAKFLEGSTLEESYRAAANHAHSWLSILTNRGAGYQTDELLKLISEEKSLSKPLEDYGAQKSNAITAVRRIVSMLGESMGKSKSLKARYIISKYPRAAANTDRAFPTLVFKHGDDNERSHFLRQWSQEPGLNSFDLADLLDWNYYIQRLEDQILKIIVIPAQLQKVANPLPQVQPPQWAIDELKQHRQIKLSDVFTKRAPQPPQLPSPDGGSIGDLEDIVDAVADRPAKRKTQEPVEVRISFANLPDPQVDYTEWLQCVKQVWDQQHKLKETRKSLWGSGPVSNIVNTKFSKFVFIPNPLETWTVLQVRPFGLGQVRVWVYDGKAIHPITVNVKRKVYVDFKENPTELLAASRIAFSKSNYTMPNGRQSEYLYEAVMDERVWQNEESDASSIFKSPLVDYVYETKVEPVHRFLIEVGSVCVMANVDKFRHGQAHGFESDWFTPSPSSKNPDLPKFNIIHVQHYEVHGQKYMVVFKSWTHEVHLLHFTPEGNRNAASLALEAEYLKLSSRGSTQTHFELPKAIEVQSTKVSTLSAFFTKCNKVLSDVYSEKSSSCVVVLQSPNPTHLYQQVRSFASFVVVELTPSYRAFSAVGFAGELCNEIIKSHLRIQDQYSLGYTIPLSGFSRVPMANFPNNDLKLVIDFVYARKLKEQRSILWWSPNGSPDPRGERVDEIKPLSKSASGWYNQICIDFEIRNFELNALLVSNFETSIDDTNETSDGVPFITNAFSKPALRSLYDLIRGWHKQARAQQWQAEDLIRQFYGWVASPTCYLYDPKLFYFVENLANGIFAKMLNVLERANYQVIHATRTRLVIGTAKYFVQSAFDAGQVIIDTLQKPSNDGNDYSILFTYLDLYIDARWDYLVWYDSSNYGGQTIDTGGVDNDAVDYDSEPILISSWGVKKYLPEELQHQFSTFYAQFLAFVSSAKRALDPTNVAAAESLREDASQAGRYYLCGGTDEVESQTETLADGQRQNQGLVATFGPQITSLVKALEHRYTKSLNKSEPAEFEFTMLPSLDPNFKNQDRKPVAEFVKCLLLAFSLDKRLELDYLELRKTLFKIINIGTFEKRAQFVNPFVKLVVPHVVCSGPGCTNVVDLDVCQLPKYSSSSQDANSNAWRCHNCSHKWDRIYLEERMIQMLVEQINRYQQQDLICVKCKRVRTDDMQKNCKCSGSFEVQIPRHQMATTIELYHQLAKYHDMKYLADLITSI